MNERISLRLNERPRCGGLSAGSLHACVLSSLSCSHMQRNSQIAQRCLSSAWLSGGPTTRDSCETAPGPTIIGTDRTLMHSHSRSARVLCGSVFYLLPAQTSSPSLSPVCLNAAARVHVHSLSRLRPLGGSSPLGVGVTVALERRRTGVLWLLRPVLLRYGGD